MQPQYDKDAKAWRIVYTPNEHTKRELWGQPVNSRLYESWDDAMNDLAKWES